jgi:flagellar M-ring protein FliF
MPIVGHDGVQAQVTAAFDFTQTEEFNDRWNPEQSAVRSEQTLEEERLGQGGAGGVPGALSNEPPGEATAPETSVAEAAEAEGQVFNDPTLAQPRNRRSETVRNYEVDRTVSHSKPTVGTIKRLSVAVVVRNPAPDEDAEEGESAAFPQETLDRMTQLVKEAIGFDETRGDTVSVLNADFFAPEEEEPLPEPAIWEQPWVWAVGKQVLGGVFVLFLVLGVLRPVFKTLMARPPAAPAMLAAPQGQALLADGGALAARPAGMQPGAPLALAGPGGIDTDLERVKSYVAQDPKVAAQVVKTWVGDQS